MITAKKLFSKFNLMNWIPYWKIKDGNAIGQSVVDEMERRGILPYELQDFYIKYGDVEMEFMEKLITERIKQGDVDKMSKIECAYLGLSEYQEFMKQVIAELSKRGVDAAIAAEQTRIDEEIEAKSKK